MKAILPEGLSIMYSSFDYFSKWLIFTSYMFYRSKRSNEVFSLFSRSKECGMTKCSSRLLSDIGVILEQSSQLENNHLSREINDWAGEVTKWKDSGMFLTMWEDINNFLNRKSIVVDRSVFLLCNSSTDLERTSAYLNHKQVSTAQDTSFDRNKSSKSPFK